MSGTEYRAYNEVRATFIDGLAVAETAAFDAAFDAHAEYADEHADIIADNFLERAAAREEALCLAEIEADGKPNPKRKNEVARVQEERPRVLAMLRILYGRVRAADNAVYNAVKAEAPDHVDAARMAVFDAVQEMEAAYAEAEKRKATVRAAMDRGDQVFRWGLRGGRHASFVVVSGMWTKANAGTTDEQFRTAARRMVSGWDTAGQDTIGEESGK